MDKKDHSKHRFVKIDTKIQPKNLPKLVASEDEGVHLAHFGVKSPISDVKDKVFNSASIRFKNNNVIPSNRNKESSNRNKRKSALPRAVTTIKEEKVRVRTRKSSIGFDSSADEAVYTKSPHEGKITLNRK